ncbi:hypothetical protein [Microcystis aeruginosa]|nr:hypothetical protein [Microcystis aeruginosa]
MSVGTLIEFYFKLIICITITEEPEKGTLFISPKTWQEYQSKAN